MSLLTGLAWRSPSITVKSVGNSASLYLGFKQDYRCNLLDKVNFLKAIICLRFPVLELHGVTTKALPSFGKC